MRLLIAGLILFLPPAGAQIYRDQIHSSTALGDTRTYRIFLPPDYESSGKRYPVIYYFHGSSDRYTLEAYDKGLDTVPKISAFVANHDVIVVAPDGYVARDYTAFYKGTPYDVRRGGGDLDFGAYFLELIAHTDSHYRTLTSRRYRATSGLSMGGFMSLYLSARYPDWVGSASAFNPGPEFYVGEKGRRSLWRPKDHVLNHQQTMIRLIRASGDYISQYHEETHEAYSIAPRVDFEFRQDEYHRHWATSIGETFAFHMRAFGKPTLDELPVSWSYAAAYKDFTVHGYHATTDASGPALIYLNHVTPGEIGLQTRQWAPDGPSAVCSFIDLTTAAVYRPRTEYTILNLNVVTSRTATYELLSDNSGRLHLETDCAGHEIGINGPGTGGQRPVLLPVTSGDTLRLPPGKALSLPIRFFNPSTTEQKAVRLEMTSAYPTVELLRSKQESISIASGAVADLSGAYQLRFTAGEGSFARTRLDLAGQSDSANWSQYLDVLVAPENIPPPLEILILDGRSETLPVFHQRGNQGGGSSVERSVTEGRGNGNGILEAGEQATVWVRVRQGMDPFDKNNWRRAKVYSDSPWLTETADIQEDKQLEWTGAQNRTSLLQLSRDTPAGTSIPLILDCEGWSYHFTPDVRYGAEPLYQAFQRHNHQLFAWTLTHP